jgi:hypothetical protein
MRYNGLLNTQNNVYALETIASSKDFGLTSLKNISEKIQYSIFTIYVLGRLQILMYQLSRQSKLANLPEHAITMTQRYVLVILGDL